MSSSRGSDSRHGAGHRSGLAVTHVVVGFRKGTPTDLDDPTPAGSVLVLDKPHMVEARKAIEKATGWAVMVASPITLAIDEA